MKDASGLEFASPAPRLVRKIRQRKRPVQKRAEVTVDAIVEGTLQVLRRDGYVALTTTRVAEKAGVSVGTLYQYFPDKRSLVTALMVRYFGRMVGAVQGAAEEVIGAPLEHAIRHTLRALLQVKRENLDLALALRGPMSELDGAGLLRDSTRQLLEVVAAMLRASAPRLKHVEQRAGVLLSALEGSVSHAVFESPHLLSEPWYLEELVALATGYLSARSSR
ncbi:MAG: TetR family transcriptional regulator [Archangium gephyra]|uniref:TetR family transcriptional regulator n=1 Tax=Archangium gephyra TaxID=48 RepID=A0A2W5TT15_9BACT|nr:MAG: TetR family transcriptional regulator [Archangium gephyra]